MAIMYSSVEMFEIFYLICGCLETFELLKNRFFKHYKIILSSYISR